MAGKKNSNTTDGTVNSGKSGMGNKTSKSSQDNSFESMNDNRRDQDVSNSGLNQNVQQGGAGGKQATHTFEVGSENDDIGGREAGGQAGTGGVSTNDVGSRRNTTDRGRGEKDIPGQER